MGRFRFEEPNDYHHDQREMDSQVEYLIECKIAGLCVTCEEKLPEVFGPVVHACNRCRNDEDVVLCDCGEFYHVDWSCSCGANQKVIDHV